MMIVGDIHGLPTREVETKNSTLQKSVGVLTQPGPTTGLPWCSKNGLFNHIASERKQFVGHNEAQRPDSRAQTARRRFKLLRELLGSV
jgi:hypothetical protein